MVLLATGSNSNVNMPCFPSSSGLRASAGWVGRDCVLPDRLRLPASVSISLPVYAAYLVLLLLLPLLLLILPSGGNPVGAACLSPSSLATRFQFLSARVLTVGV